MITLFLTYIDDENDKKLFEKLFYEYRKQMASLARSIVHNETDAEDVVHDVFLRIATRNMEVIRKIENPKDLRNYMLKATKNTALNMLKKRKQNTISIDTIKEYDIDEIQDYSDEAFLEIICNKSEYEQILHAIHSLSEKYKNVLYYHYVLELTVNETARLLNQSVPTTKKQLVRGKKMLLSSLSLEGVKKDGNY